MRKNFKIDQGNALIQGEKIFDLHNCYNFSRFSVEAKKAYFSFEPNQTWGKGLPPVLIIFEGLLYLELNLDFCSDTQFNSDEFEIDEMGYKSPNDFDYDWLLTERQADKEDHIFFRFFGDHSVRIFASQAKLKEVQMQLKKTDES